MFKLLHTSSLYGTLFTVSAGKGVNKICEGTMATQQLLVRAALCDLSVNHHEDEVGLRQKAGPMGDQDTGLRRTHIA